MHSKRCDLLKIPADSGKESANLELQVLATTLGALCKLTLATTSDRGQAGQHGDKTYNTIYTQNRVRGSWVTPF